MTPELVSVLTPSYNQAQWLEDNIRSVATQTYPRIEHIVMDGGSTDETLRILEETPLPIRWTSEPDKGQSHALNKAFAQSSGEYLGWLNSDDAYFRRDAVHLAVQAFQRHPEAAVVYGHAALVNADGLILNLMWVPRFELRTFHIHNFIIQPAAFIRRSALEDVFIDESFEYAMDHELWLRLAATHQLVRVDHVLGIDRHHASRKSYLLGDIGRQDARRLAGMYGIPLGGLHPVRLKALKVAFRLAGLSLLSEAFLNFACSAQLDSVPRFCARQTIVRRSMMPQGSSD